MQDTPQNNENHQRPPKRQRIIEAATELFATHPFSEVLVEDVARAAGVGKGTVYRYFKDKEDLFLCCIITALDTVYGVLHGLKHDEALPCSERLSRTVQALVEFYSANRRLFHILHHYRPAQSPEREKERHERWDRIRNIIRRIIEQGIEAGEFEPLDAHAVTVALMGMVRGLVHHVEDTADAVRTARALIVNGLLKRG